MNKIKIFSTVIQLLIKDRKSFLRGTYRLTKDLWSKGQVISKYKLSNGLPTADLLEILPDFNTTITNYTYLDGTSRVIDIALIKQLLVSKNNPSYIEFGSFRGESLINVHKHTQNSVSLSLSKDQMKTFGISQSVIDASNFFTDKTDGIERIESNSQTYDFKDLKGKFDLVFVDADHEYPGVKIDTTNAFSLLKDDDSIIIWHDYGNSYETINWPVLHGILDGMPLETHKHIFKVSNTICAIYSKRILKGTYPPLHIPNKTFEVSIKATKI